MQWQRHLAIGEEARSKADVERTERGRAGERKWRRMKGRSIEQREQSFMWSGKESVRKSMRLLNENNERHSAAATASVHTALTCNPFLRTQISPSERLRVQTLPTPNPRHALLFLPVTPYKPRPLLPFFTSQLLNTSRPTHFQCCSYAPPR